MLPAAALEPIIHRVKYPVAQPRPAPQADSADNRWMEKPNIEALRRRIETERAARKSGRVKFSPELKQDIVALIAHPDWGPTRVRRTLSL